MKGLVFDTENRMQFKDFGEPLLDSLQKEVGGYIEVVHPKYLPEGLCLVVDDAGTRSAYRGQRCDSPRGLRGWRTRLCEPDRR